MAERELRALEDAAKVYPEFTRHRLAPTRGTMPRDVPRQVVVKPAQEWLLSPD